MTPAQFDNGYWYATDLKEFAREVGIPAGGRLRKDELEKAIRGFLKSGKIESPTRRDLSASSGRDAEIGLSLVLTVVNYRNDKATWDFIERETEKLVGGLKRKSGARYRLNRWREAQIAEGLRITYGDLVREYARLTQTIKPFAQIPLERYVNFLSDFFAAEKGATREQALRAWAQVKELDAPKNYRSWVNFTKSKRDR
jgi:SAP domain-containing new25